jgi:hypothetical protein
MTNFTPNEMFSMLTIMSLLKHEYRDALVPHEIDGDTLDRLHDRVLAEAKRAAGIPTDLSNVLRDVR